MTLKSIKKSIKQSINCSCPFWIEKCTQNSTKIVSDGHPEFPGKSRKPPLERPRNGTTPQVAPKTTQGPPLDPTMLPGSSKRRTQDLQMTPKGPAKSSAGPKRCSQSTPKGAPTHPKKDLQIGSLLHAFLDALDLHFQCCASAPTQRNNDHTTLRVTTNRTLKQHNNSINLQKLQSLTKPANRPERRIQECYTSLQPRPGEMRGATESAAPRRGSRAC